MIQTCSPTHTVPILDLEMNLEPSATLSERRKQRQRVHKKQKKSHTQTRNELLKKKKYVSKSNGKTKHKTQQNNCKKQTNKKT